MASSFADLQQAITQLTNDQQSNSNAVSSQIQEVQRLLQDFATRTSQGDAPSSADFQAAIAQLQATDSLVKQGTASVQATTAQIQQSDPAPVSEPTQPDTPAQAPGGADTGNAGASSTAGGSLEPGDGTPHQTEVLQGLS